MPYYTHTAAILLRTTGADNMTNSIRYSFLTALKSMMSLRRELGIASIALEELNALCVEFNVTIDAADKSYFLDAIKRNNI
jgi:hypothetical protein